jgi:hypothetical protein
MKIFVVVKFLILSPGLLLNYFKGIDSINCAEIHKSLADEEIDFLDKNIFSLKNDSCLIYFRDKSFEMAKVTNLKFLDEISVSLLTSNGNYFESYKQFVRSINNFFVFFSQKKSSYTFYEPGLDYYCHDLDCSQSTFLPLNLTIDNHSSNTKYDRCYYVSESQNFTIDSETDNNLTSNDALITSFCVGPNIDLTLKINLKNKIPNTTEILNIYGPDIKSQRTTSNLKILLDNQNTQGPDEFRLNINCKNNLEINMENIFDLKKNFSMLKNSQIEINKCILSANILETFIYKNKTIEDNSHQRNFSILSPNDKMVSKNLESFLLRLFCSFNTCFFGQISECLSYWNNQTNFRNASEMCILSLNSSVFKQENNILLKEFNRTLVNHENESQNLTRLLLQRLLMHIDDFQRFKSDQSDQKKILDDYYLAPIVFFSFVTILFIIYIVKNNSNPSKKWTSETNFSTKDSNVLAVEKLKHTKKVKNKPSMKFSSESLEIPVSVRNILHLDLKTNDYNIKNLLNKSKSCDQIKFKNSFSLNETN